jgi:hypothetical protein
MARYLDELSPPRELLVESSGTVARVNAEAIAIVRNLIREVVVHAADDGGFEVEIIGDLAALMGTLFEIFSQKLGASIQRLENPKRGWGGLPGDLDALSRDCSRALLLA